MHLEAKAITMSINEIYLRGSLVSNFQDVQIIRVSLPNASMIICQLTQNKQVKHQCVEIWYNLTIERIDAHVRPESRTSDLNISSVLNSLVGVSQLILLF